MCYNISVEGIINSHIKAIYFWDDTRAYETSSDDGNLYYVAKDFNDLLKRANLNFDE